MANTAQILIQVFLILSKFMKEKKLSSFSLMNLWCQF